MFSIQRRKEEREKVTKTGGEIWIKRRRKEGKEEKPNALFVSKVKGMSTSRRRE